MSSNYRSKYGVIVGTVLIFSCSQLSSQATQISTAKNSLNQSKNTHVISPYIYGMATYLFADRAKEKTWPLQPTLFRFGGNTSERYNWKVNAWNTGADWHFMNVKASDSGNAIDSFMSENHRNGAASSVTIPLLGWISKDATSKSYNAEIDESNKELKIDPLKTSVPITPAYITNWVNHLKTKFNSFPHFYIIGNEPTLWHETHRDVHPQKATREEILEKFVSTAKLVRDADSQAVIIAPSGWGYADLDFMTWFLPQVIKKERELKTKLIDVLDVHFYPQAEELKNPDQKNQATRKALFQSVRGLWDPDFKDNSWIADKMRFIPRFKELCAKNRPDLKFSIGEYNFRAEQDISGAIVQAEILGIFAQFDLFMAQYWTIPPYESYPYLAFALLRGANPFKLKFQDNFIKADGNINNDNSFFVSQSADKKNTSILAINKHFSDIKEFNFEAMQGPSGIAKSGSKFRFCTLSEKTYPKFKCDNAKSPHLKLEPLSMGLLEILN